jgi:hypothetical protein
VRPLFIRYEKNFDEMLDNLPEAARKIYNQSGGRDGLAQLLANGRNIIKQVRTKRSVCARVCVCVCVSIPSASPQSVLYCVEQYTCRMSADRFLLRPFLLHVWLFSAMLMPAARPGCLQPSYAALHHHGQGRQGRRRAHQCDPCQLSAATRAQLSKESVCALCCSLRLYPVC